jgi:hypothetical protein
MNTNAGNYEQQAVGEETSETALMTRDATAAQPPLSSSSSSSSISSADSVLAAFIALIQQFLEALHEVFPECPKVSQYAFGLTVRLNCCASDSARNAVGREAIEAYHQSMSPFYARCIEHDDTLLSEDIEAMSNIDMHLKWTDDLHAETKASIWEYITKLNEFANIFSMYKKIPTGMLSSIESIAHGIAGQIGDGTMNMSDLNLQTMAEQVMQALSSEDIMEFASQMQTGSNADLMENVTTMYSMMSSLMKSQQM